MSGLMQEITENKEEICSNLIIIHTKNKTAEDVFQLFQDSLSQLPTTQI
jgi:hypothetical protein